MKYFLLSDSLEALYAVNTQPLLLNEGLGQYNIRKLSELPHVLARSGRFAYQALTELLLDYQWLKACVLSLSSWDLIHDFTSLIPTVPIGRSTIHFHGINLAYVLLICPYTTKYYGGSVEMPHHQSQMRLACLAFRGVIVF